MGIFNWSQIYSVNVERFDSHHKKLIELINNLFDAMKSGKGKDAVEQTLLEMKQYTLYHFNAEEALMKLHHYTDYATHKEQHQFFVAKIDELSKKLSTNSNSVAIETFDFLKDWLINHIKGSDKKYTSFFNGLGVD